VARVDDRKVLNGIFWRLRTGSRWADIPGRLPLHDLLQPFCPMAEAWRVDQLFDAVSQADEGD
jgi:transposase